MLPFHLIILGPQGSGKGTQTELLSKRFKMPYLGAGELIRKKSQEKTKEGKKVKVLHDTGNLIPHKLVKKLFEEELRKIPQEQTVIFEGYPRTQEQLRDFEDILKKRKIKDKRIIILNIREETVYKRLSGRRICSSCEKNYYPPNSLTLKRCSECGGKLIKRPDDRKDAIRKRFGTFTSETKPVIAYFKKISQLTEINGEPSIDEVSKEIIKKINEIKSD